MLVAAAICCHCGQVLLTHDARAGSAMLNTKGVKLLMRGREKKLRSIIEEVTKNIQNPLDSPTWLSLNRKHPMTCGFRAH